MYDVVIIGAGVVGGMIARTLAKYELKVCIVEKENDVAMGASKANSGIVHAGFDAAPGTLKAKLNVRGAELMPKVTKELGVKYLNNGSLVVGFSEKEKETMKELLARGEKNGVKDLQLLGREELRGLEPNIADGAVCALYAPTGAIVCPYELTVAAVGNAMDNGVEFERNFTVADIVDRGDYFEIYKAKQIVEGEISDDESVEAGNQYIKTRHIINAAGLYADKIAAMAGDTSFQIHPRRGEYILMDKECGSQVSRTIFRTPTKLGKGIVLTPTVDGNLLAGPTSVDMEDRENTATTTEGFDAITNPANQSVKGIPFNKTITSFCGLRAVGSTGDFIIKVWKRGFINVAGIESPGLSASPAIAEYVCELLKEQGVVLTEKADYNPIRKPAHAFREASMEEKNEIIRKDSSFGKIVCRCEMVTEGEILEAIRTNPGARDLDGVKRRTRAQMGRCQGGFCGPQIVELIAEELGIPYEEVTKSGEGSRVNLGRTKIGE